MICSRSILAHFAIISSLIACTKHEAAPAETAEKGLLFLTHVQGEEAHIETQILGEENVDDTILTSGKVTFDDAHVSHVYSPVSGRVTRIAAQLGDKVKKGDVLAVIESPEIGLASSDVNKAQADIVAAQHDLERQKELLAAHASSQRDYEQSEDSYRKSKAELDRAKQKVSLLRAGSFDAVTQTFTLRAEIDGEVVARTVSPGMEIQGQYSGGTALELFTVGQLDKVWVVADVYEQDLARVHAGTRVSVKVMAYPDRVFDGKIAWVSGVLDKESRTAKIRMNFDNPGLALKPEMYATAAITVDEKKALAVPRSAVVRVGDKTVVFVEKEPRPDGRRVFERMPVIIDETEGSKWLTITHGLQKGNRYVSNGAILLSGMDES
jgi:cobalt-zinc-cadmium efflux system membrane fusion protein